MAALVEATARILVEEGFDRASTNRIAEVAGVSVGSLYQYYPSKEALVLAVIERHNRAVLQLVRGVLEKLDTLPVEAAVRSLVAAAIEAHRIDPELHCVLAEQIPRTGRLQHVESATREAHDLFRNYLETRKDELGISDVKLAAFVCATSIEALAHNAVLHHAEMSSEAAVEALVNEASRLIVGYLRRNRRSN